MGVQVKPVAETVSKTNTATSDGVAHPFRDDFSQLLSAASSIAGLNYSKQTPRSRTFDLKRYGR